jgi:hypothetical protein
MLKQKINLSELNLTELSCNEAVNINGGSVFTQMGYWIGRGLEAAEYYITKPGNRSYPDHESWV